MVLRVPSYYKNFSCIADRCKDNCCIGWEIDIDEDTFSYYKSVEGEFGERLRTHMVTEECNSFTLERNGWCPFLNEKKLCDICMELGELALCEVCTEFPRFTMEYENVREKVLSLSCEEVGRLVFSTDEKIGWEELATADEYDDEWEEEDFVPQVAATLLEETRAHAVVILQDRKKPIRERTKEYLLYCEKMQQELYGCNVSEACEPAMEEGGDANEQAFADFLLRMESYERLEALDETWLQVKKQLLQTFSKGNYKSVQKEWMEQLGEKEYEYEHLLVYFTNRYFMRAYYDANILNKAKFAVASLLMIRDMDMSRYLQKDRKFTLEDRIDVARIYSKEVEHSEENMERLADDLQFEDVFKTGRLLLQL